MEDDQDTPGDRLWQAFEMFEFGVEMKAASLRRQHPLASPSEIEQLLEEWLADRPSDADGIVVQLPLLR